MIFLYSKLHTHTRTSFLAIDVLDHLWSRIGHLSSMSGMATPDLWESTLAQFVAERATGGIIGGRKPIAVHSYGCYGCYGSYGCYGFVRTWPLMQKWKHFLLNSWPPNWSFGTLAAAFQDVSSSRLVSNSVINGNCAMEWVYVKPTWRNGLEVWSVRILPNVVVRCQLAFAVSTIEWRTHWLAPVFRCTCSCRIVWLRWYRGVKARFRRTYQVQSWSVLYTSER